MRFNMPASVRWPLLCLLLAGRAHGQDPEEPLDAADASDAADAAVAVEILDFGVDRPHPNGICTDARFGTLDGGGGSGGRVHGTYNDATDCRRLFESGNIVLRDSIAPNLAGGLPRADRSTIFVDPVQQTGFGIVWFDGQSIGRRSGVPIVYSGPGRHLVGVRATEPDYACVVRIADADGAATAGEAAYATQAVQHEGEISLVSIPASTGRYYRIQADVVDDLLVLRVTDAIEDRVIVDQHKLVAAGCH